MFFCRMLTKRELFREIPISIYDYCVFRLFGRTVRISDSTAYRGQYLRPFVVIFGTLHTYHQIRMGLRRRRLVSWYYGTILCCAGGCNH